MLPRGYTLSFPLLQQYQIRYIISGQILKVWPQDVIFNSMKFAMGIPDPQRMNTEYIHLHQRKNSTESSVCMIYSVASHPQLRATSSIDVLFLPSTYLYWTVVRNELCVMNSTGAGLKSLKLQNTAWHALLHLSSDLLSLSWILQQGGCWTIQGPEVMPSTYRTIPKLEHSAMNQPILTSQSTTLY